VNGVPVPERLADPTLRIVDSNGTTLGQNDNWQSDQANEISETELAPTNPAEAAIRLTLPSGGTTILLRGKDNGTGIGLVEIYEVGQPPSTAVDR
jgi:hypothetical protein